MYCFRVYVYLDQVMELNSTYSCSKICVACRFAHSCQIYRHEVRYRLKGQKDVIQFRMASFMFFFRFWYYKVINKAIAFIHFYCYPLRFMLSNNPSPCPPLFYPDVISFIIFFLLETLEVLCQLF